MSAVALDRDTALGAGFHMAAIERGWLSAMARAKPNPGSIRMAQKNVVIRSYNLDGDSQCVDIFRRPDGTYGFEEYRREPEDGRGWFAIGDYSPRSFDRESDALANAKASIPWLSSIVERAPR